MAFKVTESYVPDVPDRLVEVCEGFPNLPARRMAVHHSFG
jgi:hypothetical protein